MPQWFEQQLALVLHASLTFLQLEYTQVLAKHSPEQQSALIEQRPPTATHALAHFWLAQLPLQQPAGFVQASPSWPLVKHAKNVMINDNLQMPPAHVPQHALVPQSEQEPQTFVVVSHCNPETQGCELEQLSPDLRMAKQVPAAPQ